MLVARVENLKKRIAKLTDTKRLLEANYKAVQKQLEDIKDDSKQLNISYEQLVVENEDLSQQMRQMTAKLALSQEAPPLNHRVAGSEWNGQTASVEDQTEKKK